VKPKPKPKKKLLASFTGSKVLKSNLCKPVKLCGSPRCGISQTLQKSTLFIRPLFVNLRICVVLVSGLLQSLQYFCRNVGDLSLDIYPKLGLSQTCVYMLLFSITEKSKRRGMVFANTHKDLRSMTGYALNLVVEATDADLGNKLQIAKQFGTSVLIRNVTRCDHSQCPFSSLITASLLL